MNKSSFTAAEYFGNSLADAYMLPGQLVVSAASSVLNTVIGDKDFLLSVFFSTVLWLLLFALALKALGVMRRTAANIGAAVATLMFKFRTKWACRKQSRTLVGRSAPSDPDAEIHFDKLDLAVLNSAATLGPGFALTAPDLANEFDLRPPQVQSRLEKLATNMMLERGFGTDEDYQTYQLSRAGATFLSILRRKRD